MRFIFKAYNKYHYERNEDERARLERTVASLNARTEQVKSQTFRWMVLTLVVNLVFLFLPG